MIKKKFLKIPLETFLHLVLFLLDILPYHLKYKVYFIFKFLYSKPVIKSARKNSVYVYLFENYLHNVV